MEVSSHALYKVELRTSGIIYVERSGEETERSLKLGFEKVAELAALQRKRGMPVLILNHAHGVDVSERVLERLLHFDFDRIAVYGTPKRTNNIRDLMVRASGLEGKIVSFQNEQEALAWLEAF